MKQGSQEKKSLRRAFLLGFLLTLLFCSFLFFSGVALRNTVAAMYGSDTRVVEIYQEQKERPIYQVELLQNEYEVELTGLNEAAGAVQQYYPLVPQPLRLALCLGEGLRRLLEAVLA